MIKSTPEAKRNQDLIDSEVHSEVAEMLGYKNQGERRFFAADES